MSSLNSSEKQLLHLFSFIFRTSPQKQRMNYKRHNLAAQEILVHSGSVLIIALHHLRSQMVKSLHSSTFYSAQNHGAFEPINGKVTGPS